MKNKDKKEKKGNNPIEQKKLYFFHGKEYSICDLLALLSLALLMICEIASVIYLAYRDDVEDIIEFMAGGLFYIFTGLWAIFTYPIIPLIPVMILAFILYIKALSLNGYRRNSLQEKIRKICKVVWSIVLILITSLTLLTLLTLPFAQCMTI